MSAPLAERVNAQPAFTTIHDEILDRAGAQLRLYRLDHIPGALNGNKAFKLMPAVTEALRNNAFGLASFGGAWSNHLHALAAAGRAYGLKTLGVVRGDAHAPPGAMLEDAGRWGMNLHFVSRSEYRQRRDPDFLAQLQARFPGYCWLPEGGSDLAGVQSCAALGRALNNRLETGEMIILPCGTGGTLAGLLAGLAGGASGVQVVGYSALKRAGFLEADIRQWHAALEVTAALPGWRIEQRFHGGGYGKCNSDLQAFIAGFYRRHGVALDPVYNGKMLWGVYRQLAAGELQGKRITALHTGGLQGLRGYPDLLAQMTQMGFEGLQQGF